MLNMKENKEKALNPRNAEDIKWVHGLVYKYNRGWLKLELLGDLLGLNTKNNKPHRIQEIARFVKRFGLSLAQETKPNKRVKAVKTWGQFTPWLEPYETTMCKWLIYHREKVGEKNVQIRDYVGDAPSRKGQQAIYLNQVWEAT